MRSISAFRMGLFMHDGCEKNCELGSAGAHKPTGRQQNGVSLFMVLLGLIEALLLSILGRSASSCFIVLA